MSMKLEDKKKLICLRLQAGKMNTSMIDLYKSMLKYKVRVEHKACQDDGTYLIRLSNQMKIVLVAT